MRFSLVNRDWQMKYVIGKTLSPKIKGVCLKHRGTDKYQRMQKKYLKGTRATKDTCGQTFQKSPFLKGKLSYIFCNCFPPKKKANMAWFEYAYFSLRCNTRVWIIQKKEKGKVGATCQFS